MAENIPIANLRYPLANIDNESDFLFMEIYRYNRSEGDFLVNQQVQRKIKRTGTKANDFVTSILLPIPSNLIDSNGVSWGDSSLNVLQAEGIQGLEGIMGSDFGNALDKVGEAIQGLGNAAVDLQSEGGALTSAIAASIVSSFGPQVTLEDVIGRRTGKVLNPNMESLFRGPNLRKFSFNFQFSPRTDKESGVIKQIIRQLKQSMAPRRGDSGAFLQTPDIFQLSFKGKGGTDHEYLFNMKPMALVNMSANYTGSGTYATYWDGSPVLTNVQLTFQEIAPIYQDDYTTDIKGVGY